MSWESVIATIYALTDAVRKLERATYSDEATLCMRAAEAMNEIDRVYREREELRKALVGMIDLYDSDEGCRTLPEFIEAYSVLIRTGVQS